MTKAQERKWIQGAARQFAIDIQELAIKCLTEPARPEPPLDPNWKPPDWFRAWQQEAREASDMDVYEVYYPPEDPWAWMAIGEWKTFVCPKGQAPPGVRLITREMERARRRSYGLPVGDRP